MQATFERFESYDFDADANFQAGLKSILAKQQEKTADEQKEAIDNAKFFYFSRFVEAFDLNEYKAWKSSRQAPSGQDSTVAPTSAPSQSTATPSSEPTYPKSFQEICELIASGKPIPGIRQIPNNLAEGTPSEAKMAPRRKPWEKAVNEKSQDEQANQATGSSSDATVA